MATLPVTIVNGGLQKYQSVPLPIRVTYWTHDHKSRCGQLLESERALWVTGMHRTYVDSGAK